MDFETYKILYLRQNVIGYEEAIRLWDTLRSTPERNMIRYLEQWLKRQELQHYNEIVQDYEGIYDAEL